VGKIGKWGKEEKGFMAKSVQFRYRVWIWERKQRRFLFYVLHSTTVKRDKKGTGPEFK
jgi:hypothetical protein